MKPVCGDLLHFGGGRGSLCPIEHDIDSQIALHWMEADKGTLTGYMDGTLLPLDFVLTDRIQETKKGFAQIFYGVRGIFVVGSEKQYQHSAISIQYTQTRNLKPETSLRHLRKQKKRRSIGTLSRGTKIPSLTSPLCAAESAMGRGDVRGVSSLLHIPTVKSTHPSAPLSHPTGLRLRGDALSYVHHPFATLRSNALQSMST